jgi:Uma2 family endonuclease
MIERDTQPTPTIPNSTPRAEPIIVPRPGRPWTVADLPAPADNEQHYELVRGDLLMMSPVSPVQGHYAARLIGALQPYVEDNDLGAVYTAEPGFTLELEPELVIRAPDVAFVRKERIPPAEQQAGYWPLAPDLAVGVISPSETATSVQAKVQDYLAAGTRLIWLVYPDNKIVVEYQLPLQIRQYDIAESLAGGAVIPGFQYALQRLFRE